MVYAFPGEHKPDLIDDDVLCKHGVPSDDWCDECDGFDEEVI